MKISLLAAFMVKFSGIYYKGDLTSAIFVDELCIFGITDTL